MALEQNKLTSLPHSLGNLKELDTLTIGRNLLTEFPFFLHACPLKFLQLEQNCFAVSERCEFDLRTISTHKLMTYMKRVHSFREICWYLSQASSNDLDVILPFSIVEIRCLICGMTLRLMEISLPYY
jgi:Leucine-rich repeat (LRR) protein